MVRHRPSHDTPAENVEHHSLEHKPRPSRHVGEVGHREPVRGLGLESALDQVRRRTPTRLRRLIARIEHGTKGRNPRFIVTNLDGQAKALYERVYCQRGEMENRIKEQQLCRPHLEPPMVDESISGGARGPGLYPARDDAPHCTAGHGPCPSTMPNHPTAAFEDRRSGDPKYPHRRGAAVQHLPRPSVVPAPGAPAHRRIARSERAVAERGVPGFPRTGALRPRTPPRLENTLPRPCQLLRSALRGHLRPIPVPNMRREMPHYVQTTKKSPFM